MPRRPSSTDAGAERDALLAKFVQENPSPLMRIGKGARVLYANTAARAIKGFFVEEGNRAASEIASAARKALKQGTTHRTEMSDGERRFSFTVVPVGDEAYVNFYGREVTGEHRAQRQIHSLARFPEENPSPVLRVRSDGLVLYANSGAKAVEGLLLKDGRKLSRPVGRDVVAAYEAGETRSIMLESADRHFALTCVPVSGTDYVNIYGREVTREHRALRQVRSLARFPEENPSPVLRVRSDGLVLYANSGAKTVEGLLLKDGRKLSRSIEKDVVAAYEAGEYRSVIYEFGERCFALTCVPISGMDYVNVYGRDVTKEQQARRQIADLAKFPEENPNPVLRIEKTGAVLFANSAARRLGGLMVRGGRRLTGKLDAAVKEAFAAGKSHLCELDMKERRYVFALTPLSGEHYVNIYGRDVTDERQAQMQAFDLARFPEENPNPVLRVKRNGELLYANSAAGNLAGLIGDTDGRLAPEIARLVSRCYGRQEIRQAEFESGARLFSFVLTPVSGRSYVNLYGRDITEERRANLELVRVKNFNQNILDNLSNGVLTFDSLLRLTSANPAARSVLGLSRGEAEGTPAAALLAPDNGWLLEVIEGSDTAVEPKIWLDRVLVGKGGRRTSVNVTSVPLRDEEGSGPGLMLVIEDITREMRVKGTMVRFMSDSVVEQLLDVDEALLAGTTQEATILFSDIREFTGLSEKLGAQEMVGVLNAYFSDMVDIIFENGGTLDKFIGDALMAVFGAPFVTDDDTDNAVLAAIRMLRRLKDFNLARLGEGRLPIDIGIGIDTGTVIAGTIGSPKRMDYTVIGEHVNLASRIESVNKHYGTRILVSQHTKAKLRGTYRMREIDTVQVSGIEKQIQLFEVLDHHTEDSFPRMDEVLDAFAEGLGHYRNRQWSAAAKAFSTALNANPGDRPTQIFLSRCWSLKARPPGRSWTGITNLAG